MEIRNFKLAGDLCRFVEAGKSGGEFGEGLPETIVIHYTAGPSMDSAIHTFKDPAVRASAHILVDADGSVTQLIPFNKIAWHCGESRWLDRFGLNSYSIGIEIVNAGPLDKNGSRWVSWFGKSYPREEVVRSTHKNESKPIYWHRYSAAQIDSVMEICRVLMMQYSIRFILGHDDISPGRKRDPGPAFPLEKIRERLLGNDRSGELKESRKTSESATVSATAVNIRSGPGTSYETIATPLSNGT